MKAYEINVDFNKRTRQYDIFSLFFDSPWILFTMKKQKKKKKRTRNLIEWKINLYVMFLHTTQISISDQSVCFFFVLLFIYSIVMIDEIIASFFFIVYNRRKSKQMSFSIIYSRIINVESIQNYSTTVDINRSLQVNFLSKTKSLNWIVSQLS